MPSIRRCGKNWIVEVRLDQKSYTLSIGEASKKSRAMVSCPVEESPRAKRFV